MNVRQSNRSKKAGLGKLTWERNGSKTQEKSNGA